MLPDIRIDNSFPVFDPTTPFWVRLSYLLHRVYVHPLIRFKTTILTEHGIYIDKHRPRVLPGYGNHPYLFASNFFPLGEISNKSSSLFKEQIT